MINSTLKKSIQLKLNTNYLPMGIILGLLSNLIALNAIAITNSAIEEEFSEVTLVPVTLVDQCAAYPIANISIEVTSTNPDFIDTTLITDSNGEAELYLSLDGDYNLYPKLPPQYQLIGGSIYTITNYKAGTPIIVPLMADKIFGTIAGIAFYDENKNDEYEPGEQLIAKQKVVISYESIETTVTTKNDGSYHFDIPCGNLNSEYCYQELKLNISNSVADSLYPLNAKYKTVIYDQCDTTVQNIAFQKYMEISGSFTSVSTKKKDFQLYLSSNNTRIDSITGSIKASSNPIPFAFDSLKGGEFFLELVGDNISFKQPINSTVTLGEQTKTYSIDKTNPTPAFSIIQVPDISDDNEGIDLKAGLLFAAIEPSGNLKLKNLAFKKDKNSFSSATLVNTIQSDSGQIYAPKLTNYVNNSGSIGSHITLTYSMLFVSNIFTAYYNSNPLSSNVFGHTRGYYPGGFSYPGSDNIPCFIPPVAYMYNVLGDEDWGVLYNGVSGSFWINNHGKGSTFDISTPYNQFTNGWNSPSNDVAVGHYLASSSQPGLASLICTPDSSLNLYISVTPSDSSKSGGEIITDSVVISNINCFHPESMYYADVVSGDFNGDGYIDVAAGHTTLYIFAGDGAGGLIPVFEESFLDGINLEVADINGDGRDDILEVLSNTFILSTGFNGFEPSYPEQMDKDLLFASFYTEDKKVVALGGSSSSGDVYTYSISTTQTSQQSYFINLVGDLDLQNLSVVIK